MIPGGRAPDYILLNEHVSNLVRHYFEEKKTCSRFATHPFSVWRAMSLILLQSLSVIYLTICSKNNNLLEKSH
ncbi:hypothetical protein [Guptibacillus hwajinpoensis]|uniref:hypothetical protein n=1 Tax=Guptibacillus hwajinpoensis TaxID=208199 RepID=UPI0009FF7F00